MEGYTRVNALPAAVGAATAGALAVIGMLQEKYAAAVILGIVVMVWSAMTSIALAKENNK
jgi:hypothetical protein